MSDRDMAMGEIVDETLTLTLEDLAGACRVETRWVVELVEEGALPAPAGTRADWRFRGVDLIRARKLRSLQSSFDASPAAAAVMLDLMEEIERLRCRLRQMGLDES